MKSVRIILAIAALILIASCASAASSHCWYADDIYEPAPQLAFSENAQPITGRIVDGAARETYIVERGTDLNIANLYGFVANCVNGARKNVYVAVKLVEVQPDGNRVEAATNAKVSSGEACDGGNMFYGATPNFYAYTFGATKSYTFELHYARNIATDKPDWNYIKTFDVVVAPGSIEVKSTNKIIAGVQNNAYVQEAHATGNATWQIKNVGGIDVNIFGISAANCSGNIFDCAFTNFNYSKPVKLAPGEIFEARETFSVLRAQSSPAKNDLSINVLYGDAYGIKTTELSSGESPVNRSIEFNVASSAISPYKKIDHFDVEPQTTYYVQTCTDSPPNELYVNPLVGAYIIDDSGNVVAQTNFHNVPNCNPQTEHELDEMRHMNEGTQDGRGLSQFRTGNFSGKKRYTYELGGIVGITGFYKSDFLYIGTDFNSETQLVEDFIVQDRLGQQSIVLSAPTATQTVTVNAFEGAKFAGQFKPQITGQNISPPKYLFSSAKVNGVSIISGQGAPAGSTNDTSIFINADGNVYARTSAINSFQQPLPMRDVNVAWIDFEKYMFEIKGLEAGVCRNMQGETILLEGATSAKTGQGANAHVKYEWKPSAIGMNFCDIGNSNYSVCDSAQFSTELLNRLVELKNLGHADTSKTVFSAYLMQDGYTQDFKNDFAQYLKSGFFSTEFSKYVQSGSDWSRYFSQPGRMEFTPQTVDEPGVYDVSLDIVFSGPQWQFFDAQGNPSATIRTNLTKRQTIAKNILYYLPIDSVVGSQTDGKLHRIGYGTGFSGDSIYFSFDADRPEFRIATLPSAAQSEPLANLEIIKQDDFSALNSQNPGQLLSVSVKSGAQNSYVMEYAPSVPTPAIIKSEVLAAKNSSNAAYSFVVNGSPYITGEPNFTRLIETGVQKGTTIDPACTDNGALPAPALNGLLGNPSAVIGFDRQLSAVPSATLCSLAGAVSDNRSVYYFNREQFDSNILLETVLYPPAGNDVLLRNACAAIGRLYVSSKAQPSGYRLVNAGEQIALESSASQIIVVNDILAKVAASETCIVYNTQRQGLVLKPKSVGVWWNEEHIMDNFRNKLPVSLGAKVCIAQ